MKDYIVTIDEPTSRRGRWQSWRRAGNEYTIMTTLKMQDARDYEYDRAIVTFIESKAVTDFAVKYGIFVEHQKENPTTCVSVHLYGNRSAVVVQTSKVLAKKIQLLAKRASQEENAALERDIADNTALLTEELENQAAMFPEF